MKSTIILNFLVTISLFGIQIGDASRNAGMAAVDDVKFSVMTTIKDLDLYLKNLTSYLASDNEEFKDLTLEYINEIGDAQLFQITSFIVSAINQSTVADNCVKLANATIRQVVKAVDIEKCGEYARTFLSNVTNSIKSTTQPADSIMDDLDEIVMKCACLHRTKLQDCIIPKLSEPRKSVEILFNDAKNLKKINFDSIYEKQSDWLTEVVDDFIKQLSLVNKIVNSKCGINYTLTVRAV